MNKNNTNLFNRNRTTMNHLLLLTFILIMSMILTYVIVYLNGGAMYVYVHLMYISIIFSAYLYGLFGSIVVAILSGILMGPLMPLNSALGEMQTTDNWMIRLLIFVIVAVFMSTILYYMKKENLKTKIIMEEIHDGICYVSFTGEIQFANKKLCKLLNVGSPTDLVGTNIKNILINSESDHRNNELGNALRNKENLKNISSVLKNSDNEYINVDYSMFIVQISTKLSSYVFTFSDSTERLEYQKNLLNLSYIDSLTNLRNRRYFDEELAKYEDNKSPLSIVMCDIDGLKFINDSFGHLTGDYLITKSANILKQNLNGLGFVSRLDGDEFAVILHSTNIDVIDDYIQRIKTNFEAFFIHDLNMSISCGYEVRDNTMMTIDEVFTNSENNMYLEKNSSVNKLRGNAVDTIMNTLYEKDSYSEQHSKSVSEITVKIAQACQFPQKRMIEIKSASLLHDIGKIIVPIDILTKTGKLTDEEYSKVKEHPETGSRLLSGMNEFESIADIVKHHHERYDGLGYPDGIKGNDIPIESRIIAIADTFNAMTTSRPYNKVKTNEEALSEIIRCSGTQFDPDLVKVFESHFHEITQ